MLAHLITANQITMWPICNERRALYIALSRRKSPATPAGYAPEYLLLGHLPAITTEFTDYANVAGPLTRRKGLRTYA